MSDDRETELKFLFSADQAARLADALGDLGAPPAESLESIYYDDPDHALRAAGFTLRVRRGADGWVQTIKRLPGRDPGLARGEWETPVAGPLPEPGLARGTPAWAALEALAELRPAFTVATLRRSAMVEAGGARVEISLDAARVAAGDRARDFAELELELKAGPIEDLFALASDWRARFDLRLSFVTKAERGFALRDGADDAVPRFAPPVIDPALSAQALFRLEARAALGHIAAAAALVAQSPQAEAIHQLRVGARRLRGLLRTFRPLLRGAGAGRLAEDLRWLGGELNPARDLDVFLEGARADAGPADFAAIAAGRSAEREAAYARAAEAARSERLGAFLLDALAWIEQTGAAAADQARRPAARFAAEALAAARRKLLRRARRLAQLSRGRRHRARIQAKTLRYAAEAFADLYPDHPRRARRFLARLKALLDDLGALNDIAVGETLLPPAARSAAFRRAQARREAALLRDAKRHLKAFAASRRFWRGGT